MNKVFKLVYKSGPHGDECSSYEVKFFGQQTLQDLLNALDEREWGLVKVRIPNPETFNLPYATEREKYMDLTIEYKHGKIITPREKYAYLLDKVIDNNYSNFANGGWSLMNYWIKVNI